MLRPLTTILLSTSFRRVNGLLCLVIGTNSLLVRLNSSLNSSLVLIIYYFSLNLDPGVLMFRTKNRPSVPLFGNEVCILPLLLSYIEYTTDPPLLLLRVFKQKIGFFSQCIITINFIETEFRSTKV